MAQLVEHAASDTRGLWFESSQSLTKFYTEHLFSVDFFNKKKKTTEARNGSLIMGIMRTQKDVGYISISLFYYEIENCMIVPW